MKTSYALQEKAQIKNYWVLKVLTEDECGFSYLAEDMNSAKEVVLYEFFPSDLVSRDVKNNLSLNTQEDEKELRWRFDSFEKDAKALVGLSHPNLVKMIRMFKEHNTAYVVYEHKAKQTLKAYLESKKRLTENEIQKLMLPLVDALHVMHSSNIIHKNINLKSIVLDSKKGVLLGAYGLGVCNRLTNKDSCSFIPIEQCLMEDKLGSFSDVYALGAVLYTLITGEKPVDAKERSDALKSGKPDPLVALKPSAKYSESLCVSVNHSLQLNTATRIKSVTQLSGEYKKELAKNNPEEMAVIERNKKAVSALPKVVMRVSLALAVGITLLYFVVEKEKPKGAPDLFEAVENSVAKDKVVQADVNIAKDASEMARMAFAYTRGEGVTQDYKKAFEWNIKAARSGDKYGMSNLGLAYLRGYGTAKDYDKAFKWFSLSAEKNNPYAYYNLAQCYERGHGVEKNADKAISYYKKAANAGYNYSYLSLGWLLKDQKRYTEAIDAYMQVKGNGQGRAEALIGVLHQEGKGVPKNHGDAMKWYHKGASHNDSFAMSRIGWLYSKGKGAVPKDYRQAFYWYEKSARNGNQHGQANLAYLYEKGRGVSKNLQLAIEWYQSSARKGNAFSKKRLKKLGKTW